MRLPTDRASQLITLTVGVNLLVLLFPAVYSDAVVYALISKNMALSGDWINLRFLGADWLDKPHFPFWITALSFKVFGVSPFAYLLPGLLFHGLGAWFTYQLGKHLYDRETGLVGALMSLTAIRLLWSTVDLRAEAYLVPEITAALYFWLRYDEHSKVTDLVAGAAFTAMALMTKGLIVLAAIGGGLLVDWLRRGEWRTVLRVKWLAALALTSLFILPELVALYLQFDRHPEKIVFGRTGVSGIRFFFWDSQFGRLFGTGPITGGGNDPFYFVHTFLWAFLPWTVLFLGAVVVFVRRRSTFPESEIRPFVVLSMSFLIPFVLFSLTKFQLDHYLDILLPFAAILSARFFLHWLPELNGATRIYRTQITIAVVAAIAGVGLAAVAFRGSSAVWTAALPAALLVLAARRSRNTPASLSSRALVLPVLAVNVIFVVFVVANRMYFARYDAGFKIARALDSQPDLVVYDYRTSSKSIGFHAHQRYINIDSLDQLEHRDEAQGSFIVVNDDAVGEVLEALPGSHVVTRATGTATNRLAPRMLNHTRWYPNVENTRLDLVRTK